MSDREQFEKVLDQVCNACGWTRDGESITLPTSDGRRQQVELDFFEFEDTPLVRVVTAIGSTERISPLRLNTALRLNYGFPHGSLALRDDVLVLVDTLMVEDPDPDELEAVIEYLAESADHFEKTIFGPDDN